jgi:hypothetical protein
MEKTTQITKNKDFSGIIKVSRLDYKNKYKTGGYWAFPILPQMTNKLPEDIDEIENIIVELNKRTKGKSSSQE